MRLLVAGGDQMPTILDAYRNGGVGWDAFGEDMHEAQGDANKSMFLNQQAQTCHRSLTCMRSSRPTMVQRST